jgi:hypothetical protein
MSLLADHLRDAADVGSNITGIIVSPNWSEPRLDEIPHDTVRMVGLSTHGPAWRWKLAQKLNDIRTALQTTDYGPEIWQAVRFLVHSPDVLPNRLLEGTDVAVAEAYAIYCDRRLRLQTESRILTGVGIEQVASVSGFEPRVIRDYCSLFFDVVDKLSARSWIATNVIESHHEPVCYVQRMLYRSAYLGGWQVCEHLLSRYDRLGESHDLSTADGRELTQLELLHQAERVCSEYPDRILDIGNKLGNLATSSRLREGSVAELSNIQVNNSLKAVLPVSESVPNVPVLSEKRSDDVRSA